MDKLAKMTNKKEFPNDCPRCEAEDSMALVAALKWGKVANWQHFRECQACGFEEDVD